MATVLMIGHTGAELLAVRPASGWLWCAGVGTRRIRIKSMGGEVHGGSSIDHRCGKYCYLVLLDFDLSQRTWHILCDQDKICAISSLGRDDSPDIWRREKEKGSGRSGKGPRCHHPLPGAVYRLRRMYRDRQRSGRRAGHCGGRSRRGVLDVADRPFGRRNQLHRKYPGTAL